MGLFGKITQGFRQIVWNPETYSKKKVVVENVPKEEEDLKVIKKDSLPEILLIMLGKLSNWNERTLIQKSLGEIVQSLYSFSKKGTYTINQVLVTLRHLINAGFIEETKKTFVIEETKQTVSEYFYKLTLSGLIFAKILDTLKNKYATVDYTFNVLVEESVEEKIFNSEEKG